MSCSILHMRREQFFCLPPLELGEYTGFTQPIQPRPIRELTIELEINRRHGDESAAPPSVLSQEKGLW